MFKIYYFKLVFIIGFSLGVNAPEGIWSVGTYLRYQNYLLPTRPKHARRIDIFYLII